MEAFIARRLYKSEQGRRSVSRPAVLIAQIGVALGLAVMLITIAVSFGFKHGIPRDCDMIFDVRFLPNPFYIPELRAHNGTEACVADYVMNFDVSKAFANKLCDMMDFLVPQYINEGRASLVVGIGCTGGNHRSVTFAELLNKYTSDKGYNSQVVHRDIEKR